MRLTTGPRRNDGRLSDEKSARHACALLVVLYVEVGGDENLGVAGARHRSKNDAVCESDVADLNGFKQGRDGVERHFDEDEGGECCGAFPCVCVVVVGVSGGETEETSKNSASFICEVHATQPNKSLHGWVLGIFSPRPDPCRAVHTQALCIRAMKTVYRLHLPKLDAG